VAKKVQIEAEVEIEDFERVQFSYSSDFKGFKIRFRNMEWGFF